MSGVAIALILLSASDPLAALVPRAKQVAGTIPQGTKAPALGVTEVVAMDRQTLKGEPDVLVVARVQVTVVGKDYPQAVRIMKEVRRACRSYVGPIEGFAKVTCHLDNVGPDFESPEGLQMKTQDLRITFHEAA